MTIQRVVLLDGLKALYLAQRNFSQLSRTDSYSDGYNNGFKAALLSIAQMVGVSDEIVATSVKAKE